MSRRLAISVFGLILGAGPALVAQRSSAIQFHGIPASVTDPRPDGTFRGTPASVTDPTFNGRSSVDFGRSRGNFDGHGDHHHGPVFVPYYVPYGTYYDSSLYSQPEQPQQPTQPPVQVIVVKEDPSQSRDDSRYGQHSFDGRDSQREPAPEQVASAKPVPAPQAPEEVVMTTLVYRDGHKSEIRNYAIVGSNLIDLSKSPVLKKIPLASLDLDSTRKVNEDKGVDFHLP